jgi:uncharacterized protein DUF5670
VRGLLLTLFLIINKQIKANVMGNLLYLIAVILIIGWALGFFFFSLGAFIHILLVFAIIAILFRVISGDRI